jgi:Ca2+/Na+ antiporter
VVGLGFLILGSRLLVDNAVALAQAVGLSEAVIGLTIVAAGTSLPELATSLLAAFRKQPDIAIGNIVGSNIFNIVTILGAAAATAPLREAWTEVGLILSAAEKRIVRLVCAGKSNKSIAASLGKSPETVKRQLSTSFRKLGVKSRSQLMARLGMHPNGGISDSPPE